MGKAEQGKGKVLRMPGDPLDTPGPAPESAGHLRQGGHGARGCQALPEHDKRQQHQNLRCQLQTVTRLKKEQPRVLVIEIDVTERQKGCESDNRVKPFEDKQAKAPAKPGPHRQARSSNMGPAEQEPPQ